MKPPSSLRSLPPKGAECRGSMSACADMDGTKAWRILREALSTFGTAGRY
jgi:hypothetical protein